MEDKVDPRKAFIAIEKEASNKAADEAFEAKIVRQILAAAGCPADEIAQLKRENRLNFWSIDEYQRNLPIHILGCRTIKVKIKDLFTRMTKTKVWAEFFELKASEDAKDYSTVGLVFRVPGLTTYICHDWVSGDIPTGVTRITRISADRTKVIAIEPLADFLKYITHELS